MDVSRIWNYWRLAVLAILCKRLTKPGKPDTTEGYLSVQHLGIPESKGKLESFATSHMTNPGKPDGIEGRTIAVGTWTWMIAIVYPRLTVRQTWTLGKPDTVEKGWPIGLLPERLDHCHTLHR